jgi:lysophospholipase L1-like esterase
VWTVTPDVHYHFNSQSLTIGSGNRLLQCPDICALAELTAPAGVGPYVDTDALGRKYLQFNGTEYALIANALNSIAARGYTVVAVMAMDHHRASCQIVNPRYETYTSDAVNTFANVSVTILQTRVVGTSEAVSAPFLQGGTTVATNNTAQSWRVIPGCELHVSGAASRLTAAGGVRLGQNTMTCDVAQSSSATNIGAIVGGRNNTNNSTAVNTSTGNVFKLYELAIWRTGLTNTNFDAQMALATTNYALTNATRGINFIGDSITDGVPTALPVSPADANGTGSRLALVGAGYVPAGVRVMNYGISGYDFVEAETRKNATNSWASAAALFPGGAANNRMFLQLGRNDSNDVDGAAIYTRCLTYMNTTTTGALQRGLDCYIATNIATQNPVNQGRLEAFRALIMDSGTLGPTTTFLNDTSSNTGGPFQGLVKIVPLSEILEGGITRFKTASDANDTAPGYYDSDGTHLRVAGIDALISGLGTPSRGWGAVVGT